VVGSRSHGWFSRWLNTQLEASSDICTLLLRLFIEVWTLWPAGVKRQERHGTYWTLMAPDFESLLRLVRDRGAGRLVDPSDGLHPFDYTFGRVAPYRPISPAVCVAGVTGKCHQVDTT